MAGPGCIPSHSSCINPYRCYCIRLAQLRFGLLILRLVVISIEKIFLVALFSVWEWTLVNQWIQEKFRQLKSYYSTVLLLQIFLFRSFGFLYFFKRMNINYKTRHSIIIKVIFPFCRCETCNTVRTSKDTSLYCWSFIHVRDKKGRLCHLHWKICQSLNE